MKLSDTAQRFYITTKYFFSNDLSSYACAGAFNFLLSSIPLALVVISICLRIWHTSGTEILQFLSDYELLSDSFDWTSSIINSSILTKPSGLLEIFAVFSVLWLSRRFFISIQGAIKRIYRKKTQRKPIKQNLFLTASEIILVLSIIFIILIITSARAFLSMELSLKIVSPVVLEILHNVFRFAPFGLLIVFLFFVYKFTPLPHPKNTLSFACALMCSVTFTVFSFVFSLIIDSNRYNLIYGLLGNLILLLIEVYFFFILFLFFAQFQYISQFYDDFIFAQIYLLSKNDKTTSSGKFEAKLFKYPVRLARYEIRVPAGQTIFSRGDKSYDVYYICSGEILIKNSRTKKILTSGEIFGDFAFLTGTYRIYSAMTETDCILLKIPPELFQEAIDVTSSVARRTLQVIAEHINEIAEGEPDMKTPHAEIEIENNL